MARDKETRNRVMNDNPELLEMNPEEIRRVQMALLDAYIDINKVCEKYGLNLMLTGGSTLGAIRHNGFIPWDDDMDLTMTRKDYEKFKDVFKEELSDKYILNAPNYSQEVYARFPKIYIKSAVFVDGPTHNEDVKALPLSPYLPVDIFIMENVPDNKIRWFIKGIVVNMAEYFAGRVELYMTRRTLHTKLLKYGGRVKYYFNLLLGFVCSIFSFTKWNNFIDKIVQFNGKSTKFCGTPTGRMHYFGEIFERKDIFPNRAVLFEGKEVKVYGNPEKYLAHMYGSFMTLPPESEREHHLGRTLK